MGAGGAGAPGGVTPGDRVLGVVDDVAALPVPVAERRAVAVAATAAELLAPGSGLARAVAAFPRADVLIATDDQPAPPDGDLRRDDRWEDGLDAAASEDLRAALAELGHPDLVAHRLALPTLLGPTAEDDLVAALSELVGFDPDAGVHCLAPAVSPATALGHDGAGRACTERAALRVARIYGLPLQRYRALGPPAVGHETA
jgi:hypothetical protein